MQRLSVTVLIHAICSAGKLAQAEAALATARSDCEQKLAQAQEAKNELQAAKVEWACEDLETDRDSRNRLHARDVQIERLRRALQSNDVHHRQHIELLCEQLDGVSTELRETLGTSTFHNTELVAASALMTDNRDRILFLEQHVHRLEARVHSWQSFGRDAAGY